MKLNGLIFVAAVTALAGQGLAMGGGDKVPPPVAVPHHDTAPDSAQVTPGPSRPVGALAPQDDLRIIAAPDAPQDFRWQARPVVVFADTPDDPAFTEQMREITRNPRALVERDVVVITDTDPAAGSDWRKRLKPNGFAVVVIDKDGQVKQRKPIPWSVREISRAIDKFPLRRQEIGRAGLLP